MTLASSRCWLSQSVETSQWLASFSSGIRCSKELHKRNPHAAVLLAFFLDRGHADRADLAGAANMRAAAGLQVEADDLDQPHLAGPDRRLHRHGFDEARVGLKLRIGDPARTHLGVGLNHL